MHPYHFEAVQLLFNLLSEHGSQSIARGNLASSIIFSTWPCVMKLNPWTEANITSDQASWCARHTLRLRIRKASKRHEIIFPFNCDRVGSPVTGTVWLIIPRRAGSTGIR